MPYFSVFCLPPCWHFLKSILPDYDWVMGKINTPHYSYWTSKRKFNLFDRKSCSSSHA